MQSPNEAGNSFQKLVTLMDILRENCPWDKKQTLKSLQKYTIEELYELMDAINEDQPKEIEEELGDVLFHTLFYSRIASEAKLFSITDVIDTVHEKLVRRHPHIFGDVKVDNQEDVKRNWEVIKLKEGKKSVLSGVPKSIPALIKAYRMQQKAQQVGFDWENIEQVWDKVDEERGELQEAIQKNDKEKIEEEFGDLLFSLINVSRFLEIDPESCLEKTNKKFKTRFEYIEKKVNENNQSIDQLSLVQLEEIWQQAKRV